MRNSSTATFVVVILLLSFGPKGAAAQGRQLSECLARAGASEQQGAFLAFDDELRSALTADDPTYLTLLSRYPLRVNDDGGMISIADATTLYKLSDTVFHEALRKQVLDTDLGNLLCTSGGIGYGHGALWVNFRRDGERRRLPTLSGFCNCGSLNVRYSKRRGLERALRLIMVRAYRCEDCQKRFFRFTPAGFVHPVWPTFDRLIWPTPSC